MKTIIAILAVLAISCATTVAPTGVISSGKGGGKYEITTQAATLEGAQAKAYAEADRLCPGVWVVATEAPNASEPAAYWLVAICGD